MRPTAFDSLAPPARLQALARVCPCDLVRRVAILLIPILALSHAAAANTLNVTTGADELIAGGTGCSLREALKDANNDTNAFPECGPGGSGDDIINLPAGTYDITLGPSGDDLGDRGDLDIVSNLNLVGAGAATTIVQILDNATLKDRVFHVCNGATANLSGLTIRNGRVENPAGTAIGGGLWNEDADLTLTNVVVTNNVVVGSVEAFGGGIFYLNGELELVNTTVSNNEARATAADGLASGGGIEAWDDIVIKSSRLDSNKVSAPTPDGEALAGGLFVLDDLTRPDDDHGQHGHWGLRERWRRPDVQLRERRPDRHHPEHDRHEPCPFQRRRRRHPARVGRADGGELDDQRQHDGGRWRRDL